MMTMVEKYGVMRECAACGKNGNIHGEVIDGGPYSGTAKPERVFPICWHCCQWWDDVDTKDDVWSAIRVRLNSGAYKLPRDVGKEGSAEG